MASGYYIKLPLNLIEKLKLKELTHLDIILISILIYKFNATKLKDDKGYIYVIWKLEKISEELGTSQPTIIKSLNNLELKGYIIMRKSIHKPTRFYATNLLIDLLDFYTSKKPKNKTFNDYL